MNKALKSILLIALAAAMLLAAGCATDKTLASVNGKPITQSELDALYNSTKMMYQQYGMNLEDTYPDAESMAAFKKQLLDSIVKKEMVVQIAAEKGLAEYTDAEIAEMKASADEEIAALKEYYRESVAGQYSSQDSAALDELVENYIKQYYDYFGATEETYYDKYIADKRYSDSFNYLVADLDVSDAEKQEYYDTELAAQKDLAVNDPNSLLTKYSSGELLYLPEGSVLVEQILVKIADEATQKAAAVYPTEQDGDTSEAFALIENDLAAIMPRMNQLQASLFAGTDFETLQSQYNEDKGTEYLVVPGCTRYYREFTAAALALANVGDVSEPAATVYGYHLLKRMDDPTVPKDYTELSDNVVENLLSDKQNARISELTEEYNEKYDIVYK